MATRIEFSDHAKDQNSIRKIPNSRIVETVKLPDRTIPSFRRRELRQKTYGNKTLEVVTVKEGNVIIVVTQYYLKGVKNGDKI